MGRYGLSYLLVLALGCGLVACGDDDDGTPVDAGPDGSQAGTGESGRGGSSGSSAGKGGMGGSAGAGTGAGTGGSSGSAGTPAMPPLECGGTECPALDPQSAMLGISACCTDDNGCGLMTGLSPNCLPRNAPGGVDSSCPIFQSMNGMFNITYFGCCTPAGKCGALAGGSLGCIPNAELMAADQSCTYDAQNTCTRIVDVACDGAEDCPGQKCCAVYQGGYRKFECGDDCSVADAPPAVYSSEACHPGDTCSVDGYSCFQNLMILPDNLYRCRDTGEAPVRTDTSTAANEVNCGDTVCGSGQKCCISIPGESVCVPKSRNCPCVPEGGDVDGGML